MRRVVFLEDLREVEIRPDTLYERYKEMVRDELGEFFGDGSKLVKTDCPGCGGKRYKKAFVKMGFQYQRCHRCGSLFASPRPAAEMLDDYYKNSKAVGFWRNEIAAKTREARYRNQMFPLGQWVLELADEYLPEAGVYMDYRSKYPGLLSAMSESGKFKQLISVKPELPEEKDLLPEGVIIRDDVEKGKEEADVFTAFEVIERIFDPAAFIREVYEKCRKQGLFFLTTNTGSGFEYQVLGGKSPRLHPPDRLNLLSVEALQDLLTGAGFELIEVSTPGRLDVELVRSAAAGDRSIKLPEFLQYVFKHRDEKAWHSLQDFLQENRLSSYLRIAARKK